MKLETIITTEIEVSTLIVEAGVRYWEDAEVNGQPDNENSPVIPLREGDLWKPVINLETGEVKDWPKGTTASVHYKVCDAGQYWLGDTEGKKLLKYQGDYVLRYLAIGEPGFGDYIIFNINGNGFIEGWKRPELDTEDWKTT